MNEGDSQSRARWSLAGDRQGQRRGNASALMGYVVEYRSLGLYPDHHLYPGAGERTVYSNKLHSTPLHSIMMPIEPWYAAGDVEHVRQLTESTVAEWLGPVLSCLVLTPRARPKLAGSQDWWLSG